MKVSLCVKKTQSVYNWKKISIRVYFIICIEVYIYSVWFLAFLLFPIEINLNHVARDRIVKIVSRNDSRVYYDRDLDSNVVLVGFDYET